MATAAVLKIEKSRYVLLMQNESLKRIGRPPSWILKVKCNKRRCSGELIVHHCANFVEIRHTFAETS